MFSRVKRSLKKSLSKNAASSSDSFNIVPPSQHIPVGNYESVVDENRHVSVDGSVATRSGYRFNLRGSWHVPCDFYKELKAYPEIQKMIALTGWHRLLDVTMPNSDQKFVEALITRWWDTTHTFHLPLVEIGITPFDFTFLTGIPIGSGDPVPAPDTTTFAEDPHTEQLYFPRRVDDPALILRSGAVSCKFVKAYLERCLIRLKAREHLDPTKVARVFLFYTLGQLFFPNGNATINIGWLGCLQDMTAIDKLDWGSAIFARILYALDSCCRAGQKSLNCFWEFIEFAMAEYVCASTPVIRQSRLDCWPGISKWARDARVAAPGVLRNNFYVSGEQLEMRSQASIRWAPYANSMHIELNPELQIAYNLSLTRRLFWDPDNFAIWYLGDRCYRQLTGKIVIPLDPPTPISAISWGEYEQWQSHGWIPASTCVARSDETGWSHCWAAVSKGPILSALTRNVNTDHVGYDTAVPDHIQLPHPPDAENNPMVYNTQRSAESASQHPTTMDWTADITGGGGAIFTINLHNANPSRRAPTTVRSQEQWKNLYYDAKDFAKELQGTLLEETAEREARLSAMEAQLAGKDDEIADLKAQLRQSRRRSHTPQSMTQGGSYPVDLAQPGGSYHVDTSQFEDSFGIHTGRHSISYDYDPSRASTSHGFSMAAPDLEYPIDPNLIRNNDYVDNLWSSQDQQ